MEYIEWARINWETIAFVASLLAALVGRFWPSLDWESWTWLRKLGGKDAVRNLLLLAAELGDKSPEEKRAWVVKELQTLSMEKLEVKLPTSVANRLVEYFFKQLKL